MEKDSFDMAEEVEMLRCFFPLLLLNGSLEIEQNKHQYIQSGMNKHNCILFYEIPDIWAKQLNLNSYSKK